MSTTQVHPQLLALSDKKRPVARILTVVLVIASLLACLLCLSEIVNARRDTLADAEVATSNIARGLAMHSETTMKVADLVLEDMVERAQQQDHLLSNSERLRQHLEQVAGKANELHGLFIYDERGEWMATSLKRYVQANNSDRDYFKYHQSHADRETRIGLPIRSRSSGVLVIPVSRRIDHPDGSFAGVALATMRLDFFEQVYSKLNVGKTGTVLLALDSGKLFYRRPFLESNVGVDISSGPLMQLYRKNGVMGAAMLTSTIDKVERLYSYRHLDGYPMVVAAALSEEEIYEDWWISTLQIATGLVFFIATLLWLGRKLLRQLAIRERLEQQLHEMSAGLIKANHELADLALQDGLTGIGNRRAFDKMLQSELARARRDRSPTSLIMLDVDYFKKFNDCYGHPAGDACLQKIAFALKREIARTTDFPARYGGEEFVILLPATEAAGAAVVAENVRAAVAALALEHASSVTGYVTVSVGVATVGGQHDHARVGAQLVRAADIALYQSKSDGRNRVTNAPSDRQPAPEPAP